MKIVVSKQDLLQALLRLSQVADAKKTTNPLFAMVLVENEGTSHVRLSATSGIQSLTTLVLCEASQGRFLVNCEDLRDRVRLMNDGPISLTQKSDKLVVQAAGSPRRFTISTVPADDFPARVDTDGLAWMSVPWKAWKTLVDATNYAAGDDESRPQLMGALLEWEGARVRMVCTDGLRLALTDVTLPEAQGSISALVPTSATTVISALGGSSELSIRLASRGNDFFADVNGYAFRTALVVAKFPPYGQVIPKKWKYRFDVGRETLLNAVRAVSVACDERTQAMVLEMAPKAIKVTAKDNDGFDEVPCDGDGQGIVGLNAKFVRKALESMSSEEVTLCFSADIAPLVMQHCDPSSSHTALIMPMRL